MRIYVLSLAAGLLVGIICGLLNIRSPAPPVAALLGCSSQCCSVSRSLRWPSDSLRATLSTSLGSSPNLCRTCSDT
jgi:Protein of unknown function (DUF1427)